MVAAAARRWDKGRREALGGEAGSTTAEMGGVSLEGP